MRKVVILVSTVIIGTSLTAQLAISAPTDTESTMARNAVARWHAHFEPECPAESIEQVNTSDSDPYSTMQEWRVSCRTSEFTYDVLLVSFGGGSTAEVIKDVEYLIGKGKVPPKPTLEECKKLISMLRAVEDDGAPSPELVSAFMLVNLTVSLSCSEPASN